MDEYGIARTEHPKGTSTHSRHGGWIRRAMVSVDRAAPGFIRSLVLAPNRRRQVVYCALAHPRFADLHDGCESMVAQQFAQLWARAAPSHLLKEVWGECPKGLIGTLSRVQNSLAQADYAALVQIWLSPDKARQICLRYTPSMSPDRIAALSALDEALCAPRLVEKLYRYEQTVVANDFVRLVRDRRPDLSDELLRKHVQQASPGTSFRNHLYRLLDLVTELPDIDLTPPPDFRLLKSRAEFKEVGASMSNCLVTKFIDEALTGRVAYLIHREHPTIAVLVAIEGDLPPK